MTLSTLNTAHSSVSINSAHECGLADWCAEHHELDCGGVVVHLSTLDIGSTGFTTALKAYSWADGEPIGGASLLVFEPLPDTPATLETWRTDLLRMAIAAVA